MNNPFRYRPSSLMAALADETVRAIAADPVLDGLFGQGKMLGILVHTRGWVLAYSGKKLPAATGLSLPSPATPADSTLGTGLAAPAMTSAYSFVPFVPPVFDVSGGIFAEKEKEISQLTARIAACGNDPEEVSRLKLERAMLSVKLQKWTFSQYRLLNARGEEKSVLDIFAAKGVLPPAAAGDCAAPKLLQYAYLNGLQPLEIGEFWYGTSPYGPVRATGRFYPACSWKCGPILDFMLQGLDIPSGVNLHGEPSVLMEDDAVIVVDKPSGMPAVPGLDGLESLEEWLAKRCPPGGEIFQVHRLDQDTSGLMVFAKTRRAQADLQRQFEERTVTKTYVAVVVPLAASGARVTETEPVVPSDSASASLMAVPHPVAQPVSDSLSPAASLCPSAYPDTAAASSPAAVGPSAQSPGAAAAPSPMAARSSTQSPGAEVPPEGILNMPLAPDHEDKPRQKVDPVQGKPAVTAYRYASGEEAVRIFRHFGLDPLSDESRALGLRAVVFRPQTGRSHQIRVHSAHPLGLGSPIAGDTLYGGASGSAPLSSRRLCLHASALTFIHPLTGAPVSLASL
ncbi:MAG: RluA family pseudouridine synthase [Candidatus Cryptobacteroides sp.]